MARSQNLQLLALCNLIATTIWISLKYDTTSALERPIHLSVSILVLCSLLCYTLQRRAGKGNIYVLLPLQQLDDHDSISKEVNSQKNPALRGRIARPARQIWALIRHHRRAGTIKRSWVLLVCCITLRVVLFGKVIKSVQCSWNGVELLLPVLLALFERVDKEHPGFYSPRYSFLLGVFAFSSLATIALTTQNSTYICPLADNWGKLVRFFQFLGLFLDAGIVVAFSRISKDSETSVKPWSVLTGLTLTSALTITIIAVLSLTRDTDGVLYSLIPPSRIVYGIFFYALLWTVCLASIVYLMSELRPKLIFTIAASISLYFSFFQGSQRGDFSPNPPLLHVAICFIGYASITGLLRLEREAILTQRSLSLSQNSCKFLAVLFGCLGTFFFGSQLLCLFTSTRREPHPINTLILDAQQASVKWEKQAALSDTLEEAVLEYQSRYGIPPPPNFDIWYEFATARGSVVIDDFGQINDDLLPFWGMKPAEIRRMTAHMMERPWTEVGSLRISNGTTIIGPHMAPTHRWMIEEASFMMNEFVKWLPDMDLAFDINDESRVTVPWAEMKKHKEDAILARKKLSQSKNLQSFSTDIAWDSDFLSPEPPLSSPSEYFYSASFRSSFEEYGTIGCLPDSLSRSQTRWNQKSFCPQCAAPHSLGPFISNWTLSGSLCHQPDLRNLHGLHLSPAAFKPTTKLYPIFSQSKIPTFNDILFPSPWNYQDKVNYESNKDPSFSRKQNTLFWRGATSEGVALHGAWQGMQRQRFVHLMNYAQNTTTHNFLLTQAQGYGYCHQSLPLSELRSATNIDVSFVDSPARCGGYDCQIQKIEFDWGTSVSFQDHWQYKYLFDLDGAGFSGRFLPFLKSRSLVLRAASFRQWFDERLTAWTHYVPVDPRLHDVWDLLAYFGGIGIARIGAREAEAQKIALDGRNWAGRVLRKNDMEVYMFRLLLEWGRIVDDRRESIGFVLPEKKPVEPVQRK
ncbi:hypothetical protein HYALB_00013743 [Hymenoscyphus albidus]|uniref:Glycosyl transferase CAP10 domain-containing protein n=1 Tax=Hymenoscyphus albidus TaxID=595503 RepID=A0A9N9LZW9_9HELO|nr:hypothetical protein HYALB_00013743 [Hymenoscyphus albidus]